MNQLGHGIELRLVEFSKNGGDYVQLYRNGTKLSDNIFRVGGLGGKFKGNYCELILYRKETDFGIWVVIDANGNVCFEAETIAVYPYIMGGIVCLVGDYYYNLVTKQLIIHKGHHDIRSKNYIFINNAYGSKYHKIEVDRGVYKLELSTGSLEKIDESK